MNAMMKLAAINMQRVLGGGMAGTVAGDIGPLVRRGIVSGRKKVAGIDMQRMMAGMSAGDAAHRMSGREGWNGILAGGIAGLAYDSAVSRALGEDQMADEDRRTERNLRGAAGLGGIIVGTNIKRPAHYTIDDSGMGLSRAQAGLAAGTVLADMGALARRRLG